jgi:hypothetical protein
MLLASVMCRVCRTAQEEPQLLLALAVKSAPLAWTCSTQRPAQQPLPSLLLLLQAQ